VLILPTAYLAPVQYYCKLLHAREPVVIDGGEHYLKQSLRNRCEILGANGVIALTIPVLKRSGAKTAACDVRIDPSKSWQHRHWNAICSAYRNSPYFEHFEERFEPFYRRRYDFLWDLNEQLRQTVLTCLRVESDAVLSRDYVAAGPRDADFRQRFSNKPRLRAGDAGFRPVPYVQVFPGEAGFVPNLSILDLLFCEGRGAVEVIRGSTTPDNAAGR
jgi:hypothetical protein